MNRRTPAHRASWILVFFLFTVSGCMHYDRPPPTGFLQNYDALRPAPYKKGLYIATRTDRTLADYSKFIVDPVVLNYHAEAKGRGADQAKVDQLANSFRQGVIDSLSADYEVVEQPGPGVMRIRPAITDMIASNPILNIHWLTKATGLGLGGAALEAEFVDAQDGEVIVAVVATNRGNPFDWLGGLVEWQYTEDVLNEWSQLLKVRLDTYHGGDIDPTLLAAGQDPVAEMPEDAPYSALSLRGPAHIRDPGVTGTLPAFTGFGDQHSVAEVADLLAPADSDTRPGPEHLRRPLKRQDPAINATRTPIGLPGMEAAHDWTPPGEIADLIPSAETNPRPGPAHSRYALTREDPAVQAARKPLDTSWLDRLHEWTPGELADLLPSLPRGEWRMQGNPNQAHGPAHLHSRTSAAAATDAGGARDYGPGHLRQANPGDSGENADARMPDFGKLKDLLPEGDIEQRRRPRHLRQ